MDIANSTNETSYSHNEKINITEWQKGKLQMFIQYDCPIALVWL